MNTRIGSSTRTLGFWAAQIVLVALAGCSSPGESNNGAGGATAAGGATSGGKANTASGGSNTQQSSGGSSNGSGNGGSNASGNGNGSGGNSNQSSGGANQSKGGSSNGGMSSSNGGSSNGGNSTSSGGSSAGSSSMAGSAAGGAAHRDHCVDGYDPDPSDATMSDGPVEFTKSNQIDLIVQPGVLSWLQAHVWEEAHFQWHNIRRCNGGMVDRTRAGGLDPCKHTELVPADQEFKTAGDGLQFLAMHRHMIQSLKQLFPKHTEQFEGFEHFPTKASDLPKQWQADWKDWDATTLANGQKADDPASHMSEKGFETEGDFGQWIQSAMPKSGLHGALHFKWVRPSNTEHGLGNQYTNIDNYMFWKMHGWIDKVWDRYRAAKGKKPTDQDIKDAVLQQCRGMDQLANLVKPGVADPGTGGGSCTTPAPKQTGVFADTIRPIFESATNKCTGCHGPQGAGANLTLGGSECVKSSDIVAALVNKPALTGGQFKLVVPGDPDKSWLYLKVTDKAKTAGCTAATGQTCDPDVMPQGGGVTLTTTEQEALRKWIADGAKAPQ